MPRLRRLDVHLLAPPLLARSPPELDYAAPFTSLVELAVSSMLLTCTPWEFSVCLLPFQPCLPSPPLTRVFSARCASAEGISTLPALCEKSRSLSRLAISDFDRSFLEHEYEALQRLARMAHQHGVRLLDDLAEFEEPAGAAGSLASEPADEEDEEDREEEDDPDETVYERRGQYGMDWDAEDGAIYRPYWSAERRKEYVEEQLSSALHRLEQHATSKLALERWRNATDEVQQAYATAEEEKETVEGDGEDSWAAGEGGGWSEDEEVKDGELYGM
ncbi:hypothetical protein JCM8547_006412 [Rhodosporidiobolus lusitaniae]